MAPLVLFYLILILLTLPLAWLFGGEPERRGAAVLLIAWLVTYVLQDMSWGRFYIGEAVVDAVTLAVFLWLAMTYRRWWLLVACAVLILIVATHLAGALSPDLTSRGGRVARMGLGVIFTLSLLGGAAERWLAGERATKRVLNI